MFLFSYFFSAHACVYVANTSIQRVFYLPGGEKLYFGDKLILF